jgi:cyclic beta-1,2-glucan synthetase
LGTIIRAKLFFTRKDEFFMLYIIIVMGVSLILLLLYVVIDIEKEKQKNVMEYMYFKDEDKEELKKHAEKISSISSEVKIKSCRRKLIKNLNMFYNKIIENYNFLNVELKNNREVIPCARWLLDNMYLIEREYSDIRYNMPRKYYRSLPVIHKGHMKGYPRIYFIAVEMISGTYGKINEENIELFIKSYQKNTVLTTGELWAFPIMIRIALIQNISGIVENIVYEQKEKNRAEIYADKIIDLYDTEGSVDEFKLREKIEELKKMKINFTPSFTERFVKVLRDNFIENSNIYKWIDEELSKKSTTFDSTINLDHQRQSNYQFEMSNCINGIREITSLDWKKNFEKLSYVEDVLRKDPINVYENMDFQSRDYYRHQIERISKKTGFSEVFIAKQALKCAEDEFKIKEGKNIEEEYKFHVGYYIVDDGFKCLINRINNDIEENKYKNSSIYNLKLTENIYITTIIISTIVLSIIVSYTDIYNGSYNTIWKYIITFLLMLIPISEIFISIFNWSINRLTYPKFIPKLELKDDIPENSSTIVVIPAIFNTKDRIISLIKKMEVYYLSNEEKNLYFAILGDFSDSSLEVEPNDRIIIETAIKKIKKLNKKYCQDGKDKFYFLCRYRKYNECEKKWMGWERKRGKLMEFNYLIRGSDSTSYNVISGDIKELYKIKYVITLDADTQLPRGAAKKLIGAMDHILNVPHILNGKIVRGHGLMQPRVSVGITSANKTLYSSIFSGDTGIDLYTSAISNVYEDLFDEGIFTGKGIYNVDTFITMLKENIPENSVLSHDLLEGSYVRTALITDVEFIDGYPAYYNSSSKRIHRWVRGDWQLIPWLFGKNGLNKLSKWKIFDNLRRSLVSPFIMMLVFWSIIIFKNPDEGLVIALLTLICPVFFNVSDSVVLPTKGVSLSGKINNFKLALEQFLLIFVFLPHKACLMVDAIVRTLYRVYISKHNLLQWQTAEDVERRSGKKLIDYIKFMYTASLIGIIIEILGFYNSKTTGILLMPSSILWVLSPYIAYKISVDRKDREDYIENDEKKLLREVERRTWAYFEDFITEDTNWLAPDNYQEYPFKGLAYRTSPTNMAMGITSNIVAYDLGYISIDIFNFRLNNIISTMETLDRYKGHFYNWYDIKTKKPLNHYVSTVDSGNLICYLWLTEATISEYLKSPIINENLIYGLEDTIKLADSEIEDKYEVKSIYGENIGKLHHGDIYSIQYFLKRLKDKSAEIIGRYSDLYWSRKVKSISEDFINTLNKYLPWINDTFYNILCNNYDVYHDICDELNEIIYNIPILDIPESITKVVEYLDNKLPKNNDVSKFRESMLSAFKNINDLIYELKNLLERINAMEASHDFSILYDSKRELFSIGYSVDNNCQDKSHYDLLASEARQASFVAIARGEVNQNHWFKLSRSMALVHNKKLIISWSGTMFEYLMPLIIMKSFPNTLFSETYKNVVRVHKIYGEKNKVPWGISECAYYKFDANSVYQYKAMGVPDIALDSNTVNELVIAPYASAMALQVDRNAAMDNIKKLIKIGAKGKYGFYESVDCSENKLVKCFMVHHQGMSFMSIDNVLKSKVLQNRFHSIPRVKAVELLLQEKIPRVIIYDRKKGSKVSYNHETDRISMPKRKYNTANTKYPEVSMMSNGNYSIMITNSGSGYSKNNEMYVYRWREDLTQDNTGMFFYIKNINSNEYWSAAYEPCRYHGENYKVTFSEDRAEFERKDGNIKTYTEVIVSQEDDAEIRSISLTNSSSHTRDIEITSYMEVTLAPYSSDLVHPAFGNLFIQTEFLEDPLCVIASRRPRRKEYEQDWVMQTVAVNGSQIGPVQYETNREEFIGRDRDLQNPKAMDSDVELTGSVGSVIDPIISLRVRVRIDPGETCKVAYTISVAKSKDKIIEMAEKYRYIDNVNREFQISTNEAYMRMKYLGLKVSTVNIYQVIASRILFLNESMKKRSNYIMNINKGQSALWSYGISGDLPIILVVIRDQKDISILRRTLNAHEYLKIKGLKIDLVVFNLEEDSYIQPIQGQISELIYSSHLRNKENQPGGVFVYNKGNMPEEDMDLVKAIARLVFDSKDGNIFKQLGKNTILKDEYDSFSIKQNINESFTYGIDTENLQYFNGFGGFSQDGKSYIIILRNYNNTPAPWINVISNKSFGFHVSESGMAYTWNKNSRENKLTSWTNDAVVDGECEALYIKDKDSGKLWSITPNPIRDSGEYVIEHGFGYSTFKHTAYEISGEITMFASYSDSVKFCSIKLKNNSKNTRRLSVSYYAKLVLGVVHENTAQYIGTYADSKNEYIYAKNPYSEHFGKLICYLKIIGGKNFSYTGDRAEFIGRCGSVKDPHGLKKEKLSNTVGAGIDPCLAEKIDVTISPNSENRIIVMLGQDENLQKINKIIEKYGTVEKVDNELKRCRDFWNGFLGTIQVHTPNKSMDIMLNGWLMYQVVSCRYWARSAFYQSGGAYGFRDQLQDVMSICYLDSKITREYILYGSTRQYLEGDVQHWWHPVVESGIRTKFSDDLLWLPYVVSDYIKNTGDYSILEEKTSYLEDSELKKDEDERYSVSKVSSQSGTIYEHCNKAIEHALKFGEHNIPLMGSGDWNDGMSTVGNQGRGESVWLGWFLYSILDRFIPICKYMNDEDRVNNYSKVKKFIIDNLEKNAWDGSWYKRAYFDDGTPLGSIQNEECRIDCIAQAWSVISKGARKSRAIEAMEALDKNLVKRDRGMVLLLTPAFDKSHLEPGYIKGYLPGIRENGAQYTHGAIWAIIAFAELGYNNKAYDIFNMLNPINHSKSYLNCRTYKLEPYVIAADIYASKNNEGRGGWSWYTGSAGWMYRAGIESILGLKFKENHGFTVNPCIPDEWNGYNISYRREKCVYNISFKRDSNKGIWIDNNKLEQNIIPYFKDGIHEVIVNI